MEKSHKLDKIEPSKIRLMSQKALELEAQGRKTLKFTLGQPDFDTPEYIKRACKEGLDKGLTGYGGYAGIQFLREEIAKKLERENSIKYDPANEIMVTIGAAHAAYLSIMTYLDPGDEIIIPNPVYNIYKMIPYIAGATVKEYVLREENNFQMDIEEIRGLITEKTKMIVIVSPSNPIGSIQTRETLEALGELLKGNDRIVVVSDEIYERLVYDGAQAVSTAAIPSLYDRTIVINGFSKAFAMTGWRIGYLAAPAHLLGPKVVQYSGFQVSGNNHFSQYAAAVALRDEHIYRTVETMRDEFQRRRDYFVEQINSMKHFSCLKPQGAFYIFMNIKKTGMDSSAFVDWLMENYDVVLVSGTAFGSAGEGFARISYASSMEDIVTACKKLHQADVALTRMGR